MTNKVTRIGIDIGKNTFHLFGVDETGQPLLRKRLRRTQLLAFLANIEPCLIGLEACSGSHYWARQITVHGHDVRLISPQFVKPYVKSNKNDYNDAEAICEAVGRPTMRFVGVKSVEQQDVQALHRIRQGIIKARTAQANQIRGFLTEYGIVIPEGINYLRRRLPEILEDAENGLTARFRQWLSELYEALCALDERIQRYTQEIMTLYHADEAVSGSARSRGSVRTRRPRWSLPTARPVNSARAVNLPRALVWFRVSTLPAASHVCSASANAAISIFERCSSTAHGPSYGEHRTRPMRVAAGSSGS